jgi:NAD(P)-dependent dehydrogenase (short-subunit alcohol dehydrogenase family)
MVAVITGAASGIGLALANLCESEGMTVVRADIEGPVAVDVTQAGAVEDLAERVFREHGAVHLLVNNAGVSGVPAPVWKLTLQDWQWVLGVNLWGVIHGIRSFVPRMIASGQEGHVVNTASIMGLMSTAMASSYCATKHAVVAITESLEQDFRLFDTRLHASVLCPAGVATRIMDSERNRPSALAPSGKSLDPEMERAIREDIAASMPPEQVAQQVLAAVREQRFWILTHPETLSMPPRRADAIIDGRHPYRPSFK